VEIEKNQYARSLSEGSLSWNGYIAYLQKKLWILCTIAEKIRQTIEELDILHSQSNVCDSPYRIYKHAAGG